MNWLTKISSEVKEDPICSIEIGGVELHGILFPAKSKTAGLFIHGTGGTFYEDTWIFRVADIFTKNGMGFLTANNRGSTSLSSYPPHGATLEKFGWCVEDIDGWLSFLRQKDFTKFVLVGHSLGAEKIVHYMSKKSKDIESIILLGFSDSYGTTKDYLGNRFDKVMNEAISLKSKGKEEEFLTTDWLCHGEMLPASAGNFIDFFSKGSDLSEALPLRKEKLEKYSKINVPILAIIGDQEEYTASTLKHAINLMRSENKNSTVNQIKNCSHDFIGQETKLCSMISNFIRTVP